MRGRKRNKCMIVVVGGGGGGIAGGGDGGGVGDRAWRLSVTVSRLYVDVVAGPCCILVLRFCGLHETRRWS